MGMYVFVGLIQIKATTNPTMKVYRIGQNIDLTDGCYIGYEGAFIVSNNTIVAIAEDIYDKWGGLLSAKNLIGNNNPVSIAIDEFKKDSPDAEVSE